MIFNLACAAYFSLERQGIILSDKYINRMMSHNEFAVVANPKMRIPQYSRVFLYCMIDSEEFS